jgi:predicted dehydrogenase
MSASPPSPAPLAALPTPLRWGIVSTGRIAGVFARDLASAKQGRLHAVGSRTLASAQRFAQERGIAAAHTHGSYAALLADAEVDAVYVATPHPEHRGVVLDALAAGKHVLCEKPIGMNLREVDEMQAAAAAADRTLMEAWMYRCHPQTERLVDLVQSGVIGELRHVQGAFSYRMAFDAQSRTWNKELGGGGILDVGGYPLSYARLLAGAAQGMPFAEPEELHAVGHLHPDTGIDEYTTAIVRFAGDVTAEVSCGVGVMQDNRLRVYGTAGWIEVLSPFVIVRGVESSTLVVHREGGDAPETIVIQPDRGLYAYEADAFAEAVRVGSREVAACTWADTRGNMAALTQWRERLGLMFAADEARPE